MEFLRAGGVNPGTSAAVETAGWGSVDNLGARPDKLKEVVLEVVSSARCKRSDYFGRKFTANMLCAHKVCEDPCNKPSRKEDSCDVSLATSSPRRSPSGLQLWVTGWCVAGRLRRPPALQRRRRGHHFQRRQEVRPAEEAWNLHHHLPLQRLDPAGHGRGGDDGRPRPLSSFCSTAKCNQHVGVHRLFVGTADV